MATVYNCLDALVQCGLVRQVTLERGATRFCPNMQEHCHFYCDACESVFDIELPADDRRLPLPKGFKAERYRHRHSRALPGVRERKRDAVNALDSVDVTILRFQHEHSNRDN